MSSLMLPKPMQNDDFAELPEQRTRHFYQGLETSIRQTASSATLAAVEPLSRSAGEEYVTLDLVGQPA